MRQNIVTFEPVDTPCSLVLMLDVSGSTLSFRQQLQLAALRFIDALGPDDRVMVIAFNEKVKTLTNFTADRQKIAWAIHIADGRGGTELYQALAFALDRLSREERRRKAVVVLTDGLDTEMRNLDRAATAQATTDEEALASIRPEAGGSLNTILAKADRLGVAIFPLALPSGDPSRLPLPSPQLTGIYTAARQRLDLLANRTGGRLNEIRSLGQMPKLYVEIAADLRRLYTIGYQVPGGRPRDGSWHRIRVEVTRPEVTARTKPGYYAR